MATSNERLAEIDALVDSTGYSWDRQYEQFMAGSGPEAENNLGHDPKSFLSMLSTDDDEVTEEELRDYIHWKHAIEDERVRDEEAERMLEEYEKGESPSNS